MASDGSKLAFEKTDLDHFPACVFLDFPRKIGFRVSGTKKKNRSRITSVKNSKNDFGGFPALSRDQIIQNSARSTRMIFPCTFQTPKLPKHVNKIVFFVQQGGWHPNGAVVIK